MGTRPPEPRRPQRAPAAPQGAAPRPPPPTPQGRPEPPVRSSPDPATPLLLHVEQMQRRLEDVGQLAGHTERLAVLGTMAAAVAHEINNILTPVKAYAEMALSNPGDTPVMVKALERAAQGVDRASRISELILACARSRPGGPQLDAPAVGVLQAAQCALDSLPPDSAGMFPVELAIQPGLAAAIDAVALEQVLLNLMLNARAAMPAGGTTRVIAYETTGSAKTAPRSSVQIEVSDPGCGMTPERLGRIFEPFATFSRGDSRPGHRRTGLGLPICRQLVVQAGGRIEIESAAGKGTTVRVIVPAAPAAVRGAA
jgi:signal transduction histidine kinase